MDPVKKVRRMLTDREVIVAPGVYDCVSAKIAEKIGFPAVYMGGFVTNASIYEAGDKVLYTVPFMAIQRAQIIWIMPVDEEEQKDLRE